MANFRIFTNNPTYAKTNGSEVSSSNPVTVVVDSSSQYFHIAKCAIRCNSGYSIASARVYFTGSNASMWALHQKGNYDISGVIEEINPEFEDSWHSEITITDIGTTNKIFWVRASAALNETPNDDTSVSIVVDADETEVTAATKRHVVSPAQPDNALFSYLSFENDLVNGEYVDEANPSRNWSVSSCSFTTDNAHRGRALQFSTDNSQAQKFSVAYLPECFKYTFDFWIWNNSTESGRNCFYVNKMLGVATAGDDGKSLTFSCYGTGNTFRDFTVDMDFSDKPHQVTIWFIADKLFAVYIDGVQKVYSTAVLPRIGSSTFSLYLGRRSSSTSFTVTIDEFKIYEGLNFIPIEGAAQWRNANHSGTANWVYLPAGATATVNEYGDMFSTDATTVQISGVSNVTGDDSNVTATLASGCAISDVTVTGAGVFNLTLTVSGTPYLVNSSGKLYYLPAYGLMSKADKHKMNWLPVENIITGAHTVSGGIALTNIKGETVCTLETGTQ